MTLTEKLIELIESKAISDKDIEVASWFVLDAMANVAAGHNTEPGRILNRWFMEEPTNTSRSVLRMGALMHILEMDDLHRRSVVHPGCVVIPTVLSVALREDIGGQQMLKAVIKGIEACTRLGNSVGQAHYKIWHNTSTCGPFGAAYAAGTLLGLGKEQLRDALGNACTQSSGLWEFVERGTMSKHLHAGHAGQSGLIAADLARHGFSGPATILEGKRGFYKACCPDAKPEELISYPEGQWQVHNTSIKPWPCCRHTHPVIDSALDLSKQLNCEKIESIELGVTKAAINVCDKPNPETLYDAKFSLQHCVSIALLDGEVGFYSFEPDSRKRAAALAILVSLTQNEEFEKAYPESWGAEVRVKLSDGKEFTVRRENAKGDPEFPLSELEIREKAMMLFRYGGVPDPEYWMELVLGLSREPSFRKSSLQKLIDYPATKAWTGERFERNRFTK